MDSLSGPEQVDEHHHLTEKEVREHAGPWLIALGVALKSFAALTVAAGLEIWGARRMHDWISLQIAHYRLDPEHGFFAWMMHHTMQGGLWLHGVVLGLVAYASLHGAEAWGLWKDKPWASWLGCVGAMIYLPFDVTAMVSRANWITIGIVAINVFVVLVLAWNIRRLRDRNAVGMR